MGMRSTVDRWMIEAHAEPWRAYFAMKQERGDLVQVAGVWVDVPNVIERPFTCDPATCSPGLRKRGRESCCAEFHVELTAREIGVLGQHFAGISRFLAARDDDWRRRVAALDDVVTPHPDNPYVRALGKRRRRCAFSFLDEGAIRCGIHGYALADGQDVFAIKPKLCFLFPLLVQDLEEGWLLTVLDHENSPLVGFTSMDELPCLDGEATFGAVEDGAPPFYVDHAATLQHLFGKRFATALGRLARDRGRRVPGDPVVPLRRRRR
jgi:hypothetical protein